MKINPKVKATKPEEQDTSDTDSTKQVVPGVQVDDKVFQWNPQKLSFQSPTGETFFCQIINNGPDVSEIAAETEGDDLT